MMSLGTARQQRGLTFANFLLGAIGLVFLALLGLKIVPAYVDNRTIAHIMDTVAHDPDLQNAQASDLRLSFDKRAMINNITVVTGDQVTIERTPMGWGMNVKYSVKIGLVANISLVLDFDTSSSRAR